MSHPPFIVDVAIDHKDGGRVRILVGELLTAVSLIELERIEQSRAKKWLACGCKTLLLLRYKTDREASEIGCYASLDEIANAIDARVVGP